MVRSLRSASFSQSVVNSTSAWRPSVCTSTLSVVTSKFSLCSFEKKKELQKLNTQEIEPQSPKWFYDCTANNNTKVYLSIFVQGITADVFSLWLWWSHVSPLCCWSSWSRHFGTCLSSPLEWPWWQSPHPQASSPTTGLARHLPLSAAQTGSSQTTLKGVKKQLKHLQADNVTQFHSHQTVVFISLSQRK